jgi:CTP:molybdopterin cytidylyltransferase MocA
MGCGIVAQSRPIGPDDHLAGLPYTPAQERNMTVGAIVLVPDPSVAVRDADGLPAIRRVVQSAWAGGALPIVVVSHPGAQAAGVGEALEGLPATFLQPEAVPPGAGWFGSGLAAARSQVRETGAALLWPVRYAWIDPETVTSLIEAHGAATGSIVRASFHGQAGFPILVPAELQSRFAAERALHAHQLVEALASEGLDLRVLELGDPGIVTDVETPRSQLAPYQGPPEPASGPPAEWNAELAAHVEPAPGPGADERSGLGGGS